MNRKLGLGGGCHWCTEAVFASVRGVHGVEQGWIASEHPYDSYSEAIVVTYDPSVISLMDLIEIHLYTHASTSNHSMRNKYRSAVYFFDKEDKCMIEKNIADLQCNFEKRVITIALPFVKFKPSLPEHINYYSSNPEKPFCTLYIHPKLKLLREKFNRLINPAI